MRGMLLGACALLMLGTGAAAAEDAPVRVATLLPWVEDALAQAPERAEVVATVRRELHTPVADGMADLGNPHSPSFEQLAMAQPDLVIGDAAIHARLREGLARSGAEVLLVSTGSVEGTFDALLEIGRRVGAEGEMRAAADDARSALDGMALEEPVATLALFGAPGSFYAISERAWIGDLLARLNFENVAAGTPGQERFPGLVPLNDEALATLRPELLLLVTHGDPTRIQQAFEERVAQGGPWRAVGESATAGVHVLDPKLFAANPGLAIPQAAEVLVGLTNGAPPAVAAPRPEPEEGG